MGKKKILKIGSLDSTFLILILVLLTFGLIMLFSASFAFAHANYGNSFHFIVRQAIFAVVGIGVMIFVSFIDYHWYQKFVFIIFGFATLLLIIVLFLPESHGVKRWINLGIISFQPSEIMKFAIITLFAHLISINYKKMGTFKVGVLPFFGILMFVAVLMLLEPHISGTVLILIIGLTMMFVGGTKLRYFMLLIGAAGGGVVAIVAIKGVAYVSARINGWLDPFSDPRNTTFQTAQSLLAIGSGGFLGQGLGQSRQKYLYLPEPQNDFIFSIICEELGFVGAFTVMLLFAFFVYRGFVIATKAPDKFGALMAVGLTVQIGIQALLNMAVVSNTIPNTGISLPFFSYGGTALFMQLAQMGIVLNISRKGSLSKL